MCCIFTRVACIFNIAAVVSKKIIIIGITIEGNKNKNRAKFFFKPP